MTLNPEAIPADFEVQPIDPDDPTAKDRATCGTCGLSWDDGKVTSMTPAPSARCPFEAFHEEEPEPWHTSGGAIYTDGQSLDLSSEQALALVRRGLIEPHPGAGADGIRAEDWKLTPQAEWEEVHEALKG